MNRETREKMDRDLHVYGNAYVRKVGAVYEHLPAEEIVVERGRIGGGVRRTRAIDLMMEVIGGLEIKEISELRSFLNTLYAERTKFIRGLTEEEQAIPTKIDRIKAVRARTGLGLLDAKEFVEAHDKKQS